MKVLTDTQQPFYLEDHQVDASQFFLNTIICLNPRLKESWKAYLKIFQFLTIEVFEGAIDKI